MKALAILLMPVIIMSLILFASGAAGDGSDGPWADSVANDQLQGRTKAGGAIAANRSDANSALGVAEDGGAVGSFYSLGFNGGIKLKFNNYICNGDGDDIEVYEVTWGGYPLERAEVWVSQYASEPDGSDFVLAGYASNGTGTGNVRSSRVALPASMGWAQYVLLHDVSVPAAFSDPNADGFDLTGVKALHSSSLPCEIQVRIDIKPGSDPNSINLNNKGNVPVAIFSALGFDATTVDRGTVRFGNTSPLGIGLSPQDVNGDGLLDIVLHFSTQALNFSAEEVTQGTAMLTGTTTGGQPFYGVDSIRIVSN